MTDKPENAREFVKRIQKEIEEFHVNDTPGINEYDIIEANVIARDAELKVQTAAMLEKARAAFDGVESIVEFYLKREIEAPANHQEFAREAQEKLDAFRQAQRALIPTDYAAALADREAEIHHGYQCGETYARLVSAQVDSIVAERVREAVLAELEDFSKTLDESDWASASSNFGDDELMRRILKYRAAAVSGEAAQPK